MASNFKNWIQRLRKGDQSAFLPLYEKTAPGLMRFLLWKSRGDRPLSEDILQEVYVRFLLNIDKLESDKDISVHSYLLQTARNCFVDKVSRASGSKATHLPIETAHDLTDSVEGNKSENAVRIRELAIAMDSLEEKDSEIIWLRDALGLSHREVGARIGVTEQASRQAYVRAKRSLMSVLGPKLTPLTAGPGGAYAAVP